MKPYVVAAGAALILFSVAALVFLIGIESEADSSFTSGIDLGPNGSPGGDSDPPAVVTGEDVELPGLEDLRELLREHADDGEGDEDRPPPPLARGNCELALEVQDPAGEPVAGVAVALLAGLARDEGETDALGVWVFAEIAPGSYTLRLQGDDTPLLEAARAISLEAGERRELTLTLGRFDLSIAGRVLDHEGEPVSGIVVEAQKYLLRPSDTDLVLSRRIKLTANSGDDGKYEIRGLDAAEYLVSTRKTDAYASVRQVFRSGVTSADLRLASQYRLEIAGRILGAEDLPLPGARVVPLGSFGASSLSDEEGRYELALEVTENEDLCVLKVSRQGYRDERVNLSLKEMTGPEPWPLDIRLEPVGATSVVSGRVVDEEGEPVEGETVHFYSSQLKARYQVTSRGDGTFHLEAVQLADDYKVWLFPRTTYKDYTLRPVGVDRDGLALEIRLERVASGTVRGTMVDPLHRPVAGFVFWLRSTKAQGRSVSVTSDDQGHFEVSDVTAGKLVFETRSLPRFTVKGFVLKPDGEVDVTLVLDWGEETLAGTVVDPQGEVVPGAKVNLLWTHKSQEQQSVSFRHTVTDATGRFSFSELSAGVHRIHVVSGDYRGVQISHDVGNDPSEPVIRLTRGR